MQNTPVSTEEKQKDDALKFALLHQGLDERIALFIIEKGERFLEKPEVLARKLSIEVFQAKKALDELRNYKRKQISKGKIKDFELLVKNNPKDSLNDIALLYDIDENVVSAYLNYIESIPLTKTQKIAVKEKVTAGYSLQEIADQLKISQIKVKRYVDTELITFSGAEGKKMLDIITHNIGKYPVMKLREMIVTKNILLQEQICCHLAKKNKRAYRELEQYFMKFEESQSFIEIDETLSFEARECIRASSLDDTEKLSKKFNRLQIVIKYYLLRYYPDESISFFYKQEQLKRMYEIIYNLGMDEQISHTTYRMVISDSFENLLQNAKKSGKQPRMVLKELLPLAFYYVKCSLPLEVISQMMMNLTNIPLTALDIFHLIFQMSDPIVRGFCIEHYSFSNPVPFHYPRFGFYSQSQKFCPFETCKELWYSLQQFNGLVSFGLGWASWNPIGKSHLLDLLFETDFLKGSPQNSPFHLGSIDIQLTKNLYGNKEKNKCERTLWAYIDCHGYSDSNFIQKVCHNLDIALIHVTYSDFSENFSLLERDLITYTLNTQHVYVLVRDYPENRIKSKQLKIKNKTYVSIFIPHLLNPNRSFSPDLTKLGYEILHSNTANLRLVDSTFIEYLIRDFEGDYCTHLDNEKELIHRIIQHIYTKVENEKEFLSLSYYPYFIEYMRCFYEATNEVEQKNIDELNEKCGRLDGDLKKAKMSEIIRHFNEIIIQENSTLILWKLAQELKIHAEKYTLEILWREAILSNKYIDNKINEEIQFGKEFASNFSNYVERGEPFELIDGDNLRFFNQDIDALLSDLHENQSRIIGKNKNLKNRPPIVISIFGPQSSGKSTLLNYCFGCKFLTSAGRCTKGVYASLSKLSQPIKNSDNFLILDTEGLDAIEKGKVLKETSCIHFDRTMVLFCLAVSQVAIINVKGEIGEELRNLLQICAYSLTKLKVSKVAAPNIFFVLNQQADPDPQKHLSSINTLLEDLNRESFLMEIEGLTISDLIKVSRQNLFVLPSAFNLVSVNTQLTKLFDSDLNKLSPTVSFANKCADLRMSIIQHLKIDKTPNNQTPFLSLSEWMEMSGVIWDTIIKYQDIVKYRNIDELKCSNLLNKVVSDLLRNKIYLNKGEYQQITDEIIKHIKNNINSWSPPNVILEDVKQELDETFKIYQEEALTEFAELCQTDPLLRKMKYMCDDAKSNLNRLIYMGKKGYEDKLRFVIKVRLTEIKISENMMKFQEDIEKNADQYLELDVEEQRSQFNKVWVNCFGSDNKEEDDAERDEMFDNLYSIFRIESKTMENKQTIYTSFRSLKFNLPNIIQTLRKEIIAKFCTEPSVFAGTEHFLYPWKENKVPLKDMKPFTGKTNCEYLSKESFWVSKEKRRGGIVKLKFQTWVPNKCYPLIRYCSGYFNHPDIIWQLEKRKQILLLASQLKDPKSLERSTWEKFIDDITDRVGDFIRTDPNISHSTVKEIVNFLCNIFRVADYEINYIEAKISNAAERTLSTFAFALAYKSILEIKTNNQREKQSEENQKKEINFRYFLQKVENRKLAKGNWDRKQMRKSDQTIANKFANDLSEAIWRSVNTTCQQNINEKYFDEKKDSLSHKNLLLLAHKKITEELNTACTTQLLNNPITVSNFVVQFVCDQTKTLKILFKEGWIKITKELQTRIVQNMKDEFTEKITTFLLVLEELLDGLVASRARGNRPEGIGLDSDSNFVVADKPLDEESACHLDPKTRQAPFKSMICFLEMYLNPRVRPEEFKHFFNKSFEVDGVTMEKNHETYVLYEKPLNPKKILDEELFKMLKNVNIFSSSETIFNIKVYVEEFLCTLTRLEFQFTEAEYEKLLRTTKELFETRIINCTYQCPSCSKYCERELHPHGGKCQILTGHQICSMGGKVWNTDKERTAILLMCDDYKKNTPVLIPGKNMTWCEFKEECGDLWDWSLPQDENSIALRMENQEKMRKIWNKFGKAILQYYANEGIQIKYIPYTSYEEINKYLFSPCSYVCFVIDGTNLMSGSIKYVRHWVLDLVRNLEGKSTFKVVIYHGHNALSRECVEMFPNNSEFTSDENRIQNFVENINIYSSEETEFGMLHGLATALTEIEWKSGFGVMNTIVHLYVEPTKGYFDIFTASGKCNHGCAFDWKRDVGDKIGQLMITYKKEILINHTHPDYGKGKCRLIGYEIPSVNLDSEKECKAETNIFINYKPEN